MQFISWKTCRRAKGGRAFYLVPLHQPLLSMLYLGSFHPPADRRVYMGPSVKDLRHSHPESFHLSIPPSPEGEMRLTGSTGHGVMMLLACVHVHDCVTVITTVRSCVNAGFVCLLIVHCILLECSTSKSNISSQKGCFTMR